MATVAAIQTRAASNPTYQAYQILHIGFYSSADHRGARQILSHSRQLGHVLGSFHRSVIADIWPQLDDDYWRNRNHRRDPRGH